MKKFLLCLIGLNLLTACGTTYQVHKATGNETTHGIYYYLPKNQVRISIPVTSIKTVTGRYAAYARRCFDENDIPANAYNIPPETGDYTLENPKQEYQVGKPTFELLASPDSENRYFVDLTTPANPFKSAGGSFDLSQSQILNGAMAKVTDTTYDFAIGLATAAAKGFKASGVAGSPPSSCDGDANEAIKSLEKVRVDLLSMHSEIRTQITEKLYKDMRSHLLNREAQLLGYFFGEKAVDKKNHIIIVEPNSKWNQTVHFELFKIEDNKFKTARALNETASRVYSVNVSTPLEQCGGGSVCLTINPNKATAVTHTNGEGFAYRIPGAATFKVAHKGAQKGEKTLPIAQLGSVASLPNRFGFINSEITELKLDPLTGGISKLSVNGSGLSAEQAGALNAYIQAKKQPASAATPPADTTVADLTKQRDILLLQQQIAILEAGGTIEQ